MTLKSLNISIGLKRSGAVFGARMLEMSKTAKGGGAGVAQIRENDCSRAPRTTTSGLPKLGRKTRLQFPEDRGKGEGVSGNVTSNASRTLRPQDVGFGTHRNRKNRHSIRPGHKSEGPKLDFNSASGRCAT
jgi:hypothetical protein